MVKVCNLVPPWPRSNAACACELINYAEGRLDLSIQEESGNSRVRNGNRKFGREKASTPNFVSEFTRFSRIFLNFDFFL